MAIATWRVFADFDRDGAYETEMTDDIALPGSGITIDRGFGKDGIYRTSQAAIVVTNRAGKYATGNAASPLYGKLRPGVPVKVEATANGLPFTVWTGYIQSYKQSGFSASTVPTCALGCSDIADALAQCSPVNVLLGTRTTKEAYEAVAAAAGLTGADYEFSGLQTLPLHWARNVDALTAMAQIQQSEMGGQWFVDALGKVRGQGRHTRLGVDVAQSWGDDGGMYPIDVTVDVTDADVVSTASVQPNILVADADQQVIFSFSRNASNPIPDSLYIEPGQTYGPVLLDYPSPSEAIAAMVAGTDYTANSAVDGKGTDMTANLAVTNIEQGAGFELTLRNTHATIGLYVTKFEKRGLSHSYVQDKPIFTYSLPIPGDKTPRGITVPIPYADDSGVARDFAVQLVRTYRYPYPRATLRFIPSTPQRAAALLAIELGDLVSYRDTDVTGPGRSYSNDFWYVDRIQTKAAPGRVGSFEIIFELVPSYLFRNLDAIVYDQFNRDPVTGLGTSTSYDTWSDAAGVDIVTGGARANSDAVQTPTMGLGTGVTDGVAEVLVTGVTGNDRAGVVFRYAGASDYCRFYLDASTGEAVLHVVASGVAVGTYTAAAVWTATATVELRVIYQAGRVRCQVDGLTVIDVNDTRMSGTRAGLYAENCSGGPMFKEFYAQGLNGGPAVHEASRAAVTPMRLRRALRRVVP